MGVPNSHNLSLNQNELYQIKESYEGNNGVISSGGESSSKNHVNNGMPSSSMGKSSRNISSPIMVAGGVQPHPIHPDKVITASGHVITRPKSK